MTLIHDPGGLGFRIEHIWACLSIHEDGDEGVIAMGTTDGQMLPLIAADPERLRQIVPIAQRTALLTGKAVQLVRFDVRVDLDRFEPIP